MGQTTTKHAHFNAASLADRHLSHVQRFPPNFTCVLHPIDENLTHSLTAMSSALKIARQ